MLRLLIICNGFVAISFYFLVFMYNKTNDLIYKKFFKEGSLLRFLLILCG